MAKAPYNAERLWMWWLVDWLRCLLQVGLALLSGPGIALPMSFFRWSGICYHISMNTILCRYASRRRETSLRTILGPSGSIISWIHANKQSSCLQVSRSFEHQQWSASRSLHPAQVPGLRLTKRGSKLRLFGSGGWSLPWESVIQFPGIPTWEGIHWKRYIIRFSNSWLNPVICDKTC